MVIPSLSTAKPTSIFVWNNAEHYEQCFPAHFPYAGSYSGHGPEVNRQRLAHLLGFERRVIQHFTSQLAGFDGLANQRIFLLIT